MLLETHTILNQWQYFKYSVHILTDSRRHVLRAGSDDVIRSNTIFHNCVLPILNTRDAKCHDVPLLDAISSQMATRREMWVSTNFLLTRRGERFGKILVDWQNFQKTEGFLLPRLRLLVDEIFLLWVQTLIGLFDRINCTDELFSLTQSLYYCLLAKLHATRGWMQALSITMYIAAPCGISAVQQDKNITIWTTLTFLNPSWMYTTRRTLVPRICSRQTMILMRTVSHDTILILTTM